MVNANVAAAIKPQTSTGHRDKQSSKNIVSSFNDELFSDKKSLGRASPKKKDWSRTKDLPLLKSENLQLSKN